MIIILKPFFFTEQYGTVYYPELETDAPFVIDKTTGVISVSGRVDFDNNYKPYSFTVFAKDNEGGRSSKLFVFSEGTN